MACSVMVASNNREELRRSVNTYWRKLGYVAHVVTLKPHRGIGAVRTKIDSTDRGGPIGQKVKYLLVLCGRKKRKGGKKALKAVATAAAGFVAGRLTR
jgi:hypothetical protein